MKLGICVNLSVFQGMTGLIAGVSLLLGAMVHAEQDAPRFVENQDYFKVVNKSLDIGSELDQLAAVADIEFYYWYGCQPCLQVENALSDYLQSNPQITMVRTPLVARLSWREQAYLQPMMEQLSPQLSLPTPQDIYASCIQDCSVFRDFESSKAWFRAQLEVDELPFIDEPQIWQAEKNYRKRADSFSISQVPTIIIRETYRVDANSAKNVTRMIEIVDYLLNQSAH